MATLSYVSIPSTARRVDVKKQKTMLPAKQPSTASLPSSLNMFPQLLLSSSLPSEDAGYNPRRKRTKTVLLSNKEPLSLQITTFNFKRFVERIGPVFWLQDRVEELVTWKKGWKPTTALLCVYAFICTFPALLFVLPLVLLASFTIPNLPRRRLPPPAVTFKPLPPNNNDDESPPILEDTVDWQANVQAIQNLMGLYADAYASMTTTPIPPTLTLTILSLLIPIILFVSPFIPTRLIAFLALAIPILSINPSLKQLDLPRVYGSWSPSPSLTLPIPRLPNLPLKPIPLTPRYFHQPKKNITHLSLRLCPRLSFSLSPSPSPSGTPLLPLLLSTNALTDRIWNAELRQVELWENERYDKVTSFSKSNLKPTERAPWTRGRDGFGPVNPLGGLPESTTTTEHEPEDEHHVEENKSHQGPMVSNLTFSLAPGWKFIETEDWTVDLAAKWASWDEPITASPTSMSGEEDEEEEEEEEDKDSTESKWFHTKFGFQKRTRPRQQLDYEYEISFFFVISISIPIPIPKLKVDGGDQDGWIYTNDAWQNPSKQPYPGAVTRRRRWVRRIWWDEREREGRTLE